MGMPGGGDETMVHSAGAGVDHRVQPAATPLQAPAEEFLNPVCGPYSLDSYHIRWSIVEALKRTLTEFCGIVLDVGCGRMPYKPLILSAPSRATRFLGLDLHDNRCYENVPDLVWDGLKIPLRNASIDCAIATEVLEHMPDLAAVLSEVGRVLKPGGLFFATVPFLWPLHDVPYDEYRYTPFSLERHLAAAGFVDIVINASGGWDASLAQMLGLWVCRRPMSETWRRVLRRVAMPAYRWLMRHDRPPQVFTRSEMITGLIATARKSTMEAERGPTTTGVTRR